MQVFKATNLVFDLNFVEHFLGILVTVCSGSRFLSPRRTCQWCLPHAVTFDVSSVPSALKKLVSTVFPYHECLSKFFLNRTSCCLTSALLARTRTTFTVHRTIE